MGSTSEMIKNGEGGGNYGHAGRPGQVGGSAPREGGGQDPNDLTFKEALNSGKFNYSNLIVNPNSSEHLWFKNKVIETAKECQVELTKSQGYCAEVSVALWDKLGQPKGLVPYSVMHGDEEHVLLYSVSSKAIVDPTGSQFGSKVFTWREKAPQYTSYQRMKASEIVGARSDLKNRLTPSKDLQNVIVKSSPRDLRARKRMWVNYVRRQAFWERKMALWLRKYFKDQQKAVANHVKGFDRGITKAIEDWQFPFKDWNKRLQEEAEDFLEELYDDYGTEVLKLLYSTVPVSPDLMVSFDVTSPNVQEFLKGYTMKFAQGVNGTVESKLRGAISEGIDAGESMRDIGKRVADQYDSISKYGAERIARTETVRATNMASQMTYEQSGMVEKKEWLVANDERLCNACAVLDGETRPVDELFFEVGDVFVDAIGKEFEVTYEDVSTPPLHPHCRCAILPVVIEEPTDEEIQDTEDLELDFGGLVEKVGTESSGNYGHAGRPGEVGGSGPGGDGHAIDNPRNLPPGKWANTRPINEAVKIVGPKLTGRLKELGITAVTTNQQNVMNRGGAAYHTYTGTIQISREAEPFTIVHEIGHAADNALTSNKYFAERSFEEKNNHWSDQNLKDAIKEDRKFGKPRGPSWDDPVRSWDYEFGSPHEAFAMAFTIYHGYDLKHNNFTFQRAMPNTYKVVLAYLGKLGLKEKKDYDESQHPRDEAGRWAEGGGEGNKREGRFSERMKFNDLKKWNESQGNIAREIGLSMGEFFRLGKMYAEVADSLGRLPTMDEFLEKWKKKWAAILTSLA